LGLPRPLVIDARLKPHHAPPPLKTRSVVSSRRSSPPGGPLGIINSRFTISGAMLRPLGVACLSFCYPCYQYRDDTSYLLHQTPNPVNFPT
jgi:hypothetical protein